MNSLRSHFRILRSALIATAFGLLAPGLVLHAQPDSPPPLSCIVLKNVMVPMRDGVRLATDICIPAKNGQRMEGKFPAILERTPYNKDDSGPLAAFYVTHGYVVVSQDTRGRFRSEGVWHMMTDDVNDGYDTARWLVAQPWSDGKFAMIGTSYVGGTQHAMAEADPPGLAATIPADAVANAGYFGMRNGGAFELRFVNWIFFTAPWGSRASRDPGTRAVLEEADKHVREYLMHLPIRKGTTPLKLAPEYEDWLVTELSHGPEDPLWRRPGFDVVDNVARYKDVPTYLIGGWYDSWDLQTTMTYMALAKAKKGPIKMILGPWIHGLHEARKNGQVDFGPEAAIDQEAFSLRWYDHWLKGTANGVENEAPVKIFVMGGGSGERLPDGTLEHGGHWRDEREWPLARTRWTPYYLHGDGTLSTEKPSESEAKITYEYDPRDPVPTIGGNISSGNGIMLQGAMDQKCSPEIWNAKDTLPLSAREDVVVFMTPPLERDVEVTGPIDVRLWASSSAPDTDFTAKLIDVHPPNKDFPAGMDMNLEDGIIRARYRNSLDRPELMKPGEAYEFTIHLYPTSNVFKAGHRIRLDISSSNFPRFDVNPNTGAPLGDERGQLAAINTIYMDRGHPSCVILPLIPQLGRQKGTSSSRSSRP
jgi:putative CocE/NonD family hydrolase